MVAISGRANGLLLASFFGDVSQSSGLDGLLYDSLWWTWWFMGSFSSFVAFVFPFVRSSKVMGYYSIV